jgi:hypothetical protein
MIALLGEPQTPQRLLVNRHIGEMPLDQAIDRFYTSDVFMHTWDLARAYPHRLNRGGDHQANRALYTVVLTRMGTCPYTRAYGARRTTEGKTTKEIIRCRKHYLARELFKALTARKAPVQEDLQWGA